MSLHMNSVCFDSNQQNGFTVRGNTFQEFNQDKHDKFITAQDIELLYSSRDRLKKFIEFLGPEKYTPLREDIFEYLDKIKRNKYETLNVDKIEKLVKNRIQKMIKNKRLKRNWSEQDICILIWVVSKYTQYKKIRHIDREISEVYWSQISQLIPGVDAQSCMFKWLSLRKNKLSDCAWAPAQSILLDQLIEEFYQKNKNQQPDWTLISQKLYFMYPSNKKVYRCPKQCREHWNCYLNPKLKKGPWAHQQDFKLLTQIKQKNGQKKWAQMVKYFDGRTQNALKNRFNLIVQKQRATDAKNKNLSQLELVNSYLQKNYVSQFVNTTKIEKHEPKVQENMQSSFTINEKEQLYLNMRMHSKQSFERCQKRVLRKRNYFKKQKSFQPQNQKQSVLSYPYIFQPVITTPIKSQNMIGENQNNQIFPLQLTPVITISQLQNKFLSQMHLPQAQGIPLQLQDQIKSQNRQIICQTQIKNSLNSIQKDKTESDLEKIKIVPVKQHDMEKIKQILLGISRGQLKECSFVPCQISENKLIKFNLN